MKSKLLDMVTQVCFAASASLLQPPVGAALTLSFPGSSAGKESACNAGDPSSIPGLGRFPGEGIGYPLWYSWASLVAQTVKNLPAIQETWVQSLSWEDLLEKRMVTPPIPLTLRVAVPHHLFRRRS